MRDAAGQFVGDVIDHADVRYNLSQVARRLRIEIENGFYSPAPLLQVDVPKGYVSARPGAVISLLDLIVVCAAILKLTPFLGSKLPQSILPYRQRAALNKMEEAADVELERIAPGDVTTCDVGWDTPWEPHDFAYWTEGWLPEWARNSQRAKNAAAKYDYCARAEIRSFFYYISLNAVHEHIRKVVEEEGNGGQEVADARELLFRIYKHWAWKPGAKGACDSFLPHGNQISKFVANFALLEFDRAMERGVVEDPNGYVRYADNILILTKTEAQARRALAECERALRESGFSLEAEATQLVPTAELFDADAEHWLKKIEDPTTGPESAREFVETEFAPDAIEKLGGVYFKALEVLQYQEDDSAFDRALELFMDNPGREFLARNFAYLRHFAADRYFTGALVIKLARAGLMFPYHRYYLYRLAAYGREYSPALKELALQDAVDSLKEWYWRVGALFCLNSFDLTAGDLENIKDLTEDEANPAVRRAAQVTLWQRPVLELSDAVKDMMCYYGVGHCEYLPEYFFRVTTERELALQLLEEIRETDVRSPAFIDRLHQLDLLKNNGAVRDEFLDVVGQKIAACDLSWMRLVARLERIRECRMLYNGI